MDYLVTRRFENKRQKSNPLIERTRLSVLHGSYLFIEWKSSLRRYFRQSYALTESIVNHKSIPLGLTKGDGAKRLS